MKIRQAIKNLKWIQRLGTAPGDTLVFTIDREISQDELLKLKESLALGFPGRKCVVLSDGLRLSVVLPIEDGIKAMPATEARNIREDVMPVLLQALRDNANGYTSQLVDLVKGQMRRETENGM